MFLDCDFSEKIIDTHCHLDSQAYFGYLDEMLNHAFANGVDKIIIPGADIKDLPRAREIAHDYENVYFSCGVHPYDIDDFDLDVLKEFINDKKCVAVGECGLDYYRLRADENEIKVKQKEVFIAQIQLAIEYKKPLIVHVREANEDSFNILKTHAKDLQGGVLHCFNASELLLQLADDGFYFGIGGVLTFKNAKKLVEVLPKIPKDKLVLETDGPYLTPEPHRGKVNDPILTHFVAQKMAELLNLSKNEIIKLTNFNANRLFFQGL
ncbi:TatD family hydrolase [Campylobacter lari]|uniref:TatD family deoxyribonuclease n=3 Tax=Campylobacter lari TaxID=201 RepID=A0A825SED1_CAMLA|nr:TatD family hydrolase [Campylobacter lari]EAH5176850.1 TatD family deoxyribonuclease [Campylobacter lari]EAH8201229.1 TatD family deoxyribonuclease [Campylobacter lari]EAI0281673.1 TatD family deoxyribonuclease [Campylobacter lari]EAI1582698.1 TatD family deoxyribonuclease [Campylobacter lari]EAI3912188.1 TatD family deoxyribonuclease [Campylobacter lari]